MPKTIKKQKKSKVILPILILLILAGGGLGYVYWKQKMQPIPTTASNPLRTSPVRRGSISLSASGSGTLTAGKQQQLNFPTSGTVAELTVQVGDVVTQGQELAKLDKTAVLQASVDLAQQNLDSAQQALDELRQGAAANIANAQLKVASDQKALADAQSALKNKNVARCDQTTTDAYYSKYMIAQKNLTDLGDGGGNQDYYLKIIVPAKNLVAQAYAAYTYCAGYTQYEIDSSHAQLSLAQTQLKQDQDTLDILQKNQGINPTDLAQAENTVTNAQSDLDQAKLTLSEATMTAPFGGTIISVAGAVGDTVGTSAFITIADLANPQIQFSVDETDMDKVAIGEQAQVTFDAIPNRTFTGKVVQINPVLQTSGGYQTLQGLIQLDLSKETSIPTLPVGLTATVELVSAQANNVLLVPIQAVRDIGGGQNAVFVVGADGQPRLKVVQVGLMDSIFAEIKQGLSIGDVVSTGTSQVNNGSGQQNNGQ